MVEKSRQIPKNNKAIEHKVIDLNSNMSIKNDNLQRYRAETILFSANIH